MVSDADGAARIDTLTITWPNAEGTTQTFTDIAAHQTLKIVEGEQSVPLDRPAVPFANDAAPAHEMAAQ